MNRASHLALIALFSLALNPGLAGADVPIASCAELQAPGLEKQRAYLTNDILCEDALLQVATPVRELRLSGFDVFLERPSINFDASRAALVGPGRIVEASQPPSTVGAHLIQSSRRLTVENVDIVAVQRAGVRVSKRLRLINSSVSGGEDYGAWVGLGKAELSASSITGNAGDGVYAEGGVKVSDGSVVSGNGRDGVLTPKRTRVADSTVTGNALDPVACAATIGQQNSGCAEASNLDDPYVCADISSRRLKLKGATTCETSLRVSQCGWRIDTHGVCSAD